MGLREVTDVGDRESPVGSECTVSDREREEIRRLLQETGDAPAEGAAARKGAARGGKGDA